MTDYTVQDIKKLREATGAGFLDCKNALEKAEGNFEKARQLLGHDPEVQEKLEQEIKTRKMQYIEHQKTSKIASVESEIKMLKREIFEIKKAHNALVTALKKEASQNPSTRSVNYGTFFFGDFSG
jgi:translation elongation factor EF-Ts